MVHSRFKLKHISNGAANLRPTGLKTAYSALQSPCELGALTGTSDSEASVNPIVHICATQARAVRGFS